MKLFYKLFSRYISFGKKKKNLTLSTDYLHGLKEKNYLLMALLTCYALTFSDKQKTK